MIGWRERATLVAPAAVLFVGLLCTSGIQPSDRMALVEPLSSFPTGFAGYELERRLQIPEDQLRVLRPDDYLVRRYGSAAGDDAVGDGSPAGEGFELFVAYYGKQLEGSTIHSPRNCLPGAGWEPVEHRRVAVETGTDVGTVNRYVIQHRTGRRALVYYWYQGRGRIEANEYVVKWDLLRDAVVKRRTDEALVRLVFPGLGSRDAEVPDIHPAVPAVIERVAAHLPE